MENILYEPILTHTYYDEYLNTIKRYENITRSSIFIRYLNINQNVSVINDQTKGTYDKFQSGIYFDSYDYTPAIQFDININTATDKNELSGFKFDGGSEVIIYTIPEPKIGDIVLFPYEPYKSEEIFRINSISTVLGVRNKGILNYKLGLEYAPLKSVAELKISNQYAYLLSKEKNILLTEYIQLVQQIQLFFNQLTLLQFNFSEKYEMYYYQMGQFIICPVIINRLIYHYLCNEKLNDRYFDKFKKPFGVDSLDDNIGINVSNGQRVKINEDGVIYVDSNGGLITDLLDDTEIVFNYSNINPINIQLLDLFNGLKNYAIR
jgi:hypothetical protein